MQVLGARFRIAALLAASLAVGMVSCDSPAGPEPVVTVQPSGVVTLNVGDTLTVRAVVQNAGPGIRFTSSNPAVATVDLGTGLVRAMTAGEVTITATSVDDPDASASLDVRVQDTPSAVVIEQILNSAGGLIDHTNVSGNINVRLAVELGAATRLDVLLDTTVACTQSFVTSPGSDAPGLHISAAALAGATITCPINTARFDSTTGRPNFLNGAVAIRARLVGSDSRTRAQTVGFPITLANRDTLVAQVTSTKRATNASGLQWVDGDIAIDLLPVIFNRNVTLRVAEFLHQPPGRRPQLRSDTVAPFRGLIEEDSLANVTNDGMLIFVHTATTAGQSGPRLVVGPLRYDNQPPQPGTVLPRDWMGPQTNFADRFVPAGNDESGVGRIQARFYAGDPILSDSALVARGKPVTTGGDLAAGAFGSYRAAALVCDALENCVLRSGFRFGVDLTPPTIEAVDLRDLAINPTSNLTIRVQDELSGVDARGIESIVMSLDSDVSVSACGPAVEGINLPGREVGGGCVPDTLGTVLPVPRSTPGYYSYTFTPFDRAANRGSTVTRRILVDRTRPELISFSAPATYVPGDQGTFTATAGDNLDLVDIVFRLSFPAAGGNAAIAIPFATDSTVVGTPFDAEVTTSGQRTSRFPIVHSLTTVIGATRSTVVVDSVQAQAVDAAGLTATLSRALTLAGTTSTPGPFAAAATVETNIVPDLVCTRGCQTQTNDATALRVSLRITGTSALTQPFARVYYYRRDLVTGTVTLLGSPATLLVEGVVEGGQASFTYPFTWTPTPGLTGAYSIFAVGVNSAGYALRGEGKTATFFTR